MLQTRDDTWHKVYFTTNTPVVVCGQVWAIVRNCRFVIISLSWLTTPFTLVVKLNIIINLIISGRYYLHHFCVFKLSHFRMHRVFNIINPFIYFQRIYIYEETILKNTLGNSTRFCSFIGDLRKVFLESYFYSPSRLTNKIWITFETQHFMYCLQYDAK